MFLPAVGSVCSHKFSLCPFLTTLSLLSQLQLDSIELIQKTHVEYNNYWSYSLSQGTLALKISSNIMWSLQKQSSSSSSSFPSSPSSPHSSKSSLELQSLITDSPNDHYDSAGDSDTHQQQHGGGHIGAVGTATPSQVSMNIFISFVGSGMLGMPYAFSQSGHVLGTVTLAIISSFNLYSMLGDLLFPTVSFFEYFDALDRFNDGTRTVGSIMASLKP